MTRPPLCPPGGCMRCDAERSIGRAASTWCPYCDEERIDGKCEGCCSLTWKGRELEPVGLRCARCYEWTYIVVKHPPRVYTYREGDIWCPRCSAGWGEDNGE